MVAMAWSMRTTVLVLAVVCVVTAVVLVVDIRRGSPTFGQWDAFELTDENLNQLYIPLGFAHGFAVTSDVADVVYKCSWYYVAETESGFRYDDPAFGLSWPLPVSVVSDKDASWPAFDPERNAEVFATGVPA